MLCLNTITRIQTIMERKLACESRQHKSLRTTILFFLQSNLRALLIQENSSYNRIAAKFQRAIRKTSKRKSRVFKFVHALSISILVRQRYFLIAVCHFLSTVLKKSTYCCWVCRERNLAKKIYLEQECQMV